MGSTPKMIFLLLKDLNCRKQNNIQCNPLQESQPQIICLYTPLQSMQRRLVFFVSYTVSHIPVSVSYYGKTEFHSFMFHRCPHPALPDPWIAVIAFRNR